MAAAADDPRDRLGDPGQEARARRLFAEVRCLVCQNESIDESDADLAGDLRQVVRRQVAAGRSDPEIKRYLVARYGEFVLLRPTFSLGNAVLWLTPFVLVIGVGAALGLQSRRRAAGPAPLTAAEEAELRALAPPDGAPPDGPPPDEAPPHEHFVSPASAAEPPQEKQSGMAVAPGDAIGVARPGT